MSLMVCNVHFTQQPEKVVYVSNALMKTLKLSGKKSIYLRLGRVSIPATMKPIKKSGKHLYLTTGLRNSIRVPKSGNVYLLNSNADEVQIGPLIGVLSDASVRTATNPFGSRTDFIKSLLREGNKKGFFFAFAPRDINWVDDTVLGYFLSDSGTWTRKTVPLPEVVYNRLPSRRAETGSMIANLRDRFIKRKIPFFNWSFFNKSDVYELLKDDEEANQYVPESVMGPTSEKVKEMLEKHQFLYYKPTAGSLGIGIYRLTHNPKKGYFARYRAKGSNVLLRFNTFNSLMRMLQARHGRSLHNYVIQQGIRLIEIDQCPIDFRFHMHKNGSNQWVVVGIGAKKAGKGSVTTHIKNGGQLLTPEQALSRTFGARGNEVLQKAKEISISLAESIEKNYPHLLGELGFDIGIDQDEQVWMFEANAKPGRSIFKHPALRKEGKASIVHIIEHCMYLSKFRRGES
ncbi:YheC/YheD family protein [Paenibacillus terrigena]|uniref:YheC/YheD family endospore coat-associated protein n=1 Tax=Paenibacillus terrigena TaxID=369333 RepID=UPI000381F6B2|nr:YheC/YheD family protein [Paenibacillus terrigena]